MTVKRAEVLRRYRNKNREKARQYAKEWRARHIETEKNRCRERAKETRKRNAHVKNESKKSGCVMCGYKEDLRRLHFHHRDPATKKFNLARCPYHYVRTIREEIAKCDVLCEDCHRKYGAEIHKKARVATAEEAAQVLHEAKARTMELFA